MLVYGSQARECQGPLSRWTKNHDCWLPLDSSLELPSELKSHYRLRQTPEQAQAQDTDTGISVW